MPVLLEGMENNERDSLEKSITSKGCGRSHAAPHRALGRHCFEIKTNLCLCEAGNDAWLPRITPGGFSLSSCSLEKKWAAPQTTPPPWPTACASPTPKL